MHPQSPYMLAITLAVIVTEAFNVIVQALYWLGRPRDKTRGWYFTLLFLLLVYNLSLVPMPLITPLSFQQVLASSAAMVLSAYFVFYIYKTFHPSGLRFFATYGIGLFVGCPLVVFFIIPYSVTGDLDLSRKMLVILPFLFLVTFGIALARTLISRLKESHHASTEKHSRVEMISAYLAMLCVAALPALLYFDGSEMVQFAVINIGFFVLILVRLYFSIINYRREYRQWQNAATGLSRITSQYTELNERFTEMLQERMDKLELLNAERTEALVNLIHETKTPLTLINNYLGQYIAKKGDSQELQIIQANIEKLTSNVIDFFDLERFDKGFNTLYNHKEVTDLSQLLTSNLILFRSLAIKKNITFHDDICPGLLVRADKKAMERIVNNIVDNAIKFTGEGGAVTISLSAGEDNVLLTVADSGVGIPASMHSEVFKPYVRLNTEKNTGGIGAGLSIVKKIVENLEGEIVLDSAVDKGTTITIILSRYSPGNEDAETTKQILEEFNMTLGDEGVTDMINHSTTAPYILLVEDNIDLLTCLAFKLKDYYNIYVARNGVEAINKLKTVERLDLIISDVVMDGMDGFEFFETVSDLKVYDHIPFIFLTAKNTLADRERGLQMGAADYLDKPFLFEQLHQRIELVLSKFNKYRIAILKTVRSAIDLSLHAPVDSIIAPVMHEGNLFEFNCKKYGLTERQMEICKLVRDGHPYKNIGFELKIAEGTVVKHISNIFSKLNVTNKAELLNKLGRRQSNAEIESRE